jgi:hypothetical protein
MSKEILPPVSPARRSLIYFGIAATLAAMIAPGFLRAQFAVKPVNLTYLARRADVIVQGRVTDVVQESLPGYPNISTIRVTLDVEAMMRGPTGDSYSFREVVLGQRRKEGKARYRAGQHLLLFLTSPSQYGLSGPIGIEQGRFHISRNASGIYTVVNEYGNTGLFTNVQEEANNAGRPLTASQSRVAAVQNGAVPLDDFRSLVKNLMLLPRIR